MSDTCCGAPLEAGRLEGRQRRVLVAVLAINAVTFVMMAAAAAWSGSSALLSGALDNFGDALTYGLSLAVVGAGRTAKARVAMFNGLLIGAAALGVAGQIAWRLFHPATPLFETMGAAALLNFGANLACLAMLTPHRRDDVNMASVWECSRNDVGEGVAVIAAAAAVWAFGSGWPDLVVAAGLLLLFLRSSARVLGGAWRELRPRTAT